MTHTEYETALKDKDAHFAEPWSTTFCRVDHDGKMWIVYGEIAEESFCITEGELELYRLLDDDNKRRVVEYLVRVRKPKSDWIDLRNAPYQSWNENF